MARIIKFACLIGLRPAEVVESVRLINSVHPGEHKGTRRNLGTRVPKDVLKQYYNPERQASETFHSIEKSIDRPSVSGASRSHLVNDGYYYNQEQNVLQHYRFPELFIRRTKAVYISVANDE